uniref:Tryptophan synthase alpha chain n=1 Tax=Crouania attenuata TaxID=42002 RepID=A0A4D6WQH9_9FLOR|nr:Tryptophan synthase alpha subunit [Crouania attenuata]
MNDISQVLTSKSKQNSCALIPFITAGYPDIQTTIQIITTLDKEDVDIIELGIPYIDALADGPIIQEASKLALLQNTYVDDVIFSIKKIRDMIHTPIVIFTYFNPILSKGIEHFIHDLYDAGVKGLIVPDLPFEEMDYLIIMCQKYDIELICFIAPTSSSKRRLEILQKAPGCIYVVSSTGVTGIRDSVNYDINNIIIDIKTATLKPIMLGFGISTSDQVSVVSQWSIDGIVIGSALMQQILQSPSAQIIENISSFIRSIKLGIC